MKLVKTLIKQILKALLWSSYKLILSGQHITVITSNFEGTYRKHTAAIVNRKLAPLPCFPLFSPATSWHMKLHFTLLIICCISRVRHPPHVADWSCHKRVANSIFTARFGWKYVRLPVSLVTDLIIYILDYRFHNSLLWEALPMPKCGSSLRRPMVEGTCGLARPGYLFKKATSS